MDSLPVTPRTKLVRAPKRAHHDLETIYGIIDSALICHVGAQMPDRPMVQPTVQWRTGDQLYIHGSSKNGFFKALMDGVEACITITHLDGLVLGRSAMHHSMNYRCVMIFGKARLVTDRAEKLAEFDALMNKIVPGRADASRRPNEQEIKATAMLAFDISEASAKIRSGPPIDDAEDMDFPTWAGVIPVQQVFGEPLADEACLEGMLPPKLG